MIDPTLFILAPPAAAFGYVVFDLRRQERARASAAAPQPQPRAAVEQDHASGALALVAQEAA